MAETRILPCECKSDYQDKVYGKGMRLHNCTEPKKGSKAPNTCYCTVCSPNSRKVMKALFPMPHIGLTKSFPEVTRRKKSY